MNTPIQAHILFLERALALAERRKGFCSPNPSVGAVLLKEGKVVSEGMHWKAGDPHAEVMALANLSPQDTEGATLYVTLEPCSHTGRTPPCADLLIKHKLAAVYYGLQDPNPIVSGKGRDKLRQAGIICEHVPCEKIDHFYQSYQYWTQYKRPWVTAKLALSLDGKIAGPGGVPCRITGDALQAYTHQGRRSSDALLTTAKTIMHDNPQMNVRITDKEIYKKPLYVLDSRLEIPLSARIFETTSRICLFHQPEIDADKKAILLDRNVQCVAVSTTPDGKLNLDEIMAYIGQEGVHDLWVEAGGGCFEALLSQQLVHRILCYIAPEILGPCAASAFSSKISLLSNDSKVIWRQFGLDVLCEIFP